MVIVRTENTEVIVKSKLFRSKPFNYRPDRKHAYSLIWVYSVWRRKPRIVEAEIYSTSGKFLGTWAGHNVPLDLLAKARAFVQASLLPGDPAGLAWLVDDYPESEK